jgi:hypothetical protein
MTLSLGSVVDLTLMNMTAYFSVSYITVDVEQALTTKSYYYMKLWLDSVVDCPLW